MAFGEQTRLNKSSDTTCEERPLALLPIGSGRDYYASERYTVGVLRLNLK